MSRPTDEYIRRVAKCFQIAAGPTMEGLVSAMLADHLLWSTGDAEDVPGLDMRIREMVAKCDAIEAAENN